MQDIQKEEWGKGYTIIIDGAIEIPRYCQKIQE